MTFSGEIVNPDESKKVSLYLGQKLLKEIKVNEDGSFRDTLNVDKEGLGFILHGDSFIQIYLKNGFETSFKTDNDNFYASAIIEGGGEEYFNLGDQSYALEEKFTENITDIPTLENFATTSEKYREDYVKLLNEKGINDPVQVDNLVEALDVFIGRSRTMIEEKIDLSEELIKGDTSPAFVNYDNIDGGTNSLSDYRGKYVYIDLWATWCGPCMKEFPVLKEIEAEYKGRNIEFVYISMDSPEYHGNDKERARTAWMNFVEENELGSVQLISDKGFESDFLKEYKIGFIPRYIIIDPEGNIVSPDAPRPSNPRLLEIFDELGI